MGKKSDSGEGDGNGNGDGEIPEPLVFVYYVTGHGLGHATRVVEVARHLCAAGHEVHIVTGVPEFVFRKDIRSPKLHIRKVLLDCGAVQSDALTVDCRASLEQYSRTAVVNRTAVLAVEVDWLKSIKANLVVSDIVPIACQAAAQAGIPSVCISNFSWDFIYTEYVTVAGKHHQSIVWQIAEDYSHALFVIRLPGYCPMPAFRDVIDVPLIVREVSRTRQQVRKDMGVGEDVKVLLFNFGGQDTRWSLKEEFLPPGWLCWVCGAPAEQELASNFKRLDRDVYVPDLIGASDCMLGKIGYGTVSETLACKTPLVFVRRDHFNEEPFLRKMLESYSGGVEMSRQDFITGCWVPYLESALLIKPCFNGPLNGGKVAASLMEDVARGMAYTIKPQSGARRLRDAIVFGYQLQRHPGQEVDIPEWYEPTETRLGLLQANIPGDSKAVVPLNVHLQHELQVDGFDIIEGDFQGFTDTAQFLCDLSQLYGDGVTRASHLAGRPDSQEYSAAKDLFFVEDDVFVARAPGRLDVMGGIADYSGSLVLQMPIKEACHVAVQRSSPFKQQMWKHVRERQLENGGVVKPVLRIVSFGADLGHRAPTFDMDLSNFTNSGGDPISYEDALKYFEKNDSQKWAAYVAGTLLVLMRELGVRFHDSISILVSSAVPEGKGVSSSAALEVATMSAIAAAYGLQIAARDIAILCQKVENHVVGAPCGIMDQMASACGEANKLLAMVCQPAEVKEHVNIPLHIQFWGIDSGIRHSVGGSDYGSVRAGAFMGRRIIQGMAASKESHGRTKDDNTFDVSSSLDSTEQYLCNIPPHRLEGEYASVLPVKLTGQEFLEMFDSHDDPVTKVNPTDLYAIKAPTAHPVYENFRVKSFSVLLTATDSDAQLEALGELMFQSHYSYSNCGLGSKGTDRLVTLVRQAMLDPKRDVATLFGAKITGGGCGGTVCILGRAGNKSRDKILEIQKMYKEETGHHPYIFEGSSMGAGSFGYLRIRRKSNRL